MVDGLQAKGCFPCWQISHVIQVITSHSLGDENYLTVATPAAWLTRSTEWIDDDSWTWTSDRGWIAAEHGDARAKFRATEGDHMLTNVDSNLLSLVMMSIHQDPLNEVVAILVARYVDQRDAGTIRVSGCDDSQIALEKLDTTNLQAFLDN